MKKQIFIAILLCSTLVPLSALATTYTVGASNDYYSARDWWSGGNSRDTYEGTNDIRSSYYYYPGSGGHTDTMSLSFDLSSLATISADEIVSVSLYLNIISAGNADPSNPYAGNVSYGGSTQLVMATASGWTGFDFTDSFKTRFETGENTATFAGRSNSAPAAERDGVGYTFTSMESGFPAYMEINTAPVPEPATMLLFGAGLAGLAGSRLRKKR